MRVLWIITLALFAPHALGQDAPLKSGSIAGKELAEVIKLLDAKKTVEAVDKLRRLIETSGSELVTTDGKHYRPLVRVAQGIQQGLPLGEKRTIFDRSDAPAKKLLDEGKTNRDPVPLRTLVDRYFLSAYTEEALLLLADLAFERGEFRAAESYRLRLLPTSSANEDVSVEGVQTPREQLQASILLAMIFQGDLNRTRTELAAFRKEFPMAQGHLAGRTGNYAEILQSTLDRPPITRQEPAPTGDWPTFGGDYSRTGQPLSKLPRYWRSRATWQTPFPDDNRTTYPKLASTKAVGLHPVTLNGTGFVADATRVMGFDIRTGEMRYLYDITPELDLVRRDLRTASLPLTVDADFTLTTAENCVFARLGATDMVPFPQNANGKSVNASYLVCFGQAKDGQWAVKWKLAPPVPETAPAAWEAAPVVHQGKIYAAFLRETANGLMSALACYTLSDNTPEKPLWVVDLADVRPNEKSEPRHRAEPLTLAAGQLVYCTHTGSIVAVDAARGKLSWAYQYPRSAKPTPYLRDVNPAVAEAGVVYVAPTDSDRILALDAINGRLLWAVENVQVDQFLGIMHGKLIVAISGPLKGLRGYDKHTGLDVEPVGWKIHDDPQLGSWGRGLVSEDAVLWPTKSGVFFVRPTDGLPLGPRLAGPHGNLAFADGVLLVGTPTGVMGYVANPDEKPSPTGFTKLDVAETDWRQGNLDLAQKTWANLINDKTQNPEARATAVMRLVHFLPKGGGEAAMKSFSEVHVGVNDIASQTLLNPSGVPKRLSRLLREHFAVPDALPVALKPRSALPREASALPTFGAGAEVEMQLLPSPLCHPVRDFSGRRLAMLDDRPVFLVTEPGKVHACTVGGPAVWSVTHNTRLNITHGEAGEGAIFLAGSEGAMRLDAESGRVVWSMVWPEHGVPLSPLPSLPPEMQFPTSLGLANFALTPQHLIARYGETHLVALDRTTGEVAWFRAASGATRLVNPLGEPAKFNRHFAVTDLTLLTQVTPNLLASWSETAGSKLANFRIGFSDWQQPPQMLSDNLTAHANGPGSITAINTRGHEPRWTWTAPGETSLTGVAPQFRTVPGGLLVAVSRNHGVEVLRLNEAGRSLRNRGMLWPVARVNLLDGDVDATATYVPAEGQIFAVRHNDGKLKWPTAVDLTTRTLTTPELAWQTIAGLRCIAAVPQNAVPMENFTAVARRLLARFAARPTVRMLPGLACVLGEACTESRLPIVLLDPETGDTLAKHDLNCTGPSVAVAARGNFLVVATVGRAYLLKSR
jgi:outer membrane protein assembly factor BamB